MIRFPLILKQKDQKRASLWTRIRGSWRLDLTDTGRALIVGGVVATFFGSHTANVDTYILLGFFGVLCALAALWVAIARPRARIEHTFPRRVVCGEELSFSVKVENIDNRKARDLVVQPAWDLSSIDISPAKRYISSLSSHQSTEVRFRAHFSSRGNYLFPGFRVDTTFPCGLFCLGRGRQMESLAIVYPWFYPLLHFHIPTGRRYQAGGVSLASDVGDSVEYLGNREYQDGDDLRCMDWRSWARLGKPIVREYQEEYFCRVALVLDTELPQNPDSARLLDFEASLSLAAAIADFLSRQEYLIDLFAAGPEIYILESGRSLAHLDQVLDVLACLDPHRESPFPCIEPAIVERMPSLTTVIAIMLDMDRERAEFLARLRAMGVGLKTLVCTSRECENFLDDVHKIDPKNVFQGIDSL